MEKERAVTNLEKTAIIISSLPQDVASEVLRHLDAGEIEKISACMAKMGMVEGEMVDSIINDFLQMAVQGTGSVSLGKDYTESLISKVLGEDEAKSMVAKLSEDRGEQTLDLLDDLDPQTLTALIRNEHPQTMALILSHVSPEKAGKVLSDLPEELRAEVVVRISSLERVPPDVVSEVAETLENEVKSMGTVGHQLGGLKTVADILNQMDRATESSVIAKLDETDPNPPKDIQSSL